MINLNEIVMQEARPMPVFLLIDTSGSMSGQKIQTVNAALREMLFALSNIEDSRGQIKVSIITFGGTVNVLQNLTNVENITISELHASGNTPMGEAFKTAVQMIENKDVVPSRAYTPTIVLISDGNPTDISRDDDIFEKVVDKVATKEDYLKWDPVQILHQATRTSKCVRLAMGIGQDADYEMLKAFIKDEGKPVIKAKDSTGIARFFEWVTMSITTRSMSTNPNEIIDIPIDDIFDNDELIF